VRRGAGPNFSLSSNGWGEFNILVKIAYENGKITKTEHWLTLKEESDECSKKSTAKKQSKKKTTKN
jgi:transcription initiation factor IIF auxiliary subunit